MSATGPRRVFIACVPPDGWRHVDVTERRTRSAFASFIRDLVDGRSRYATKVVLVMDNLNTHSVASLYEAFTPAEAKRLADKLEIDRTPEARQLAEHRRVRAERAGPAVRGPADPGQPTLSAEAAAWEEPRNAAGSRVDWQFRTADAQAKLKRLYPNYG